MINAAKSRLTLLAGVLLAIAAKASPLVAGERTAKNELLLCVGVVPPGGADLKSRQCAEISGQSEHSLVAAIGMGVSEGLLAGNNSTLNQAPCVPSGHILKSWVIPMAIETEKAGLGIAARVVLLHKTNGFRVGSDFHFGHNAQIMRPVRPIRASRLRVTAIARTVARRHERLSATLRTPVQVDRFRTIPNVGLRGTIWRKIAVRKAPHDTIPQEVARSEPRRTMEFHTARTA